MSRIVSALIRAQVPTVLLIGGDSVLIERCHAAASEAGLSVKACPASMAASLAAERRPLVVVVTEVAYALEPEPFDAIVRNVAAVLVLVDPCGAEADLAASLVAAARESRRRRARLAAAQDGDRFGPPSSRAVSDSTPSSVDAIPASRGGVPSSSRVLVPDHAVPLAGPVKAGPLRRESPAVGIREVMPPSSRARPQLHADLHQLFDERGRPRADRSSD